MRVAKGGSIFQFADQGWTSRMQLRGMHKEHRGEGSS